MRHSLDGIARFGRRAWLWNCLLVAILNPLSPAAATDPLGLEAAVAEVRAALEDMANALNGAPRRVQTTISTDLHLTSQATARALDRLDGEPIADPTLVYDLNLLADIAHAATDELHAIAAEPGATLDPERARGVDRLTEAAAARLAEVNLVIDGWNERGRNAVVELEDDDGALVIRSTDRFIYNGIRYVSVALLLVGLLALGLHLLRTSHERPDARPRVPKGPLQTGLGAVALVAFFASCTAFSLRPAILAALSAEVRVQAQEHPCERLAAQRDRLIAAQGADHSGLIEATKQRMRPAAQDCLGLPSEAVTVEAIERLAAKTALAHNEPAPGRRPAVGVAAAEPRRGDAGPARTPEVAQLQPAEMQARGGLAELLTSLRDIEPPVAALPEPAHGPTALAIEPADPAPEAAPATEPDPATKEAGPAAPSEPATEIAEPATDAADPAREPADPATEPADRARETAGPATGPATPAMAPIEPAAGPSEIAKLETPPQPGPPTPAAEVDSVVFVATTAVNYRDGPSVDARRLGTLFPGARLMVLERDAGWAQVRLDDGQQAYVASEFIEPAP